MLFKNIGLIDEDFSYQPNMWVGTSGNTIAYVGNSAPKNADVFGETYDGSGRLLCPAFYNAHAHMPMTLLRGYAENLPLQNWLNDKVWPFEAKLSAEDNYWGMLLSLGEMARYGCVSASDMYLHTAIRAQAVEESLMKANLCESEVMFQDVPFSELAVSKVYTDLAPKLHESAEGRIRMDCNIHAEYTSFPQACADIAAVAKEQGLAIHVHVSETQLEHEQCKERHGGMTPIQYFESIGVLDVPVIAAHCVWVEDADMSIMKERSVSVASCPASNMKLGSGFAPVPEMLKRGISVALGTDGMASNNNHDMLQDAYLLALLHKGNTSDPTVVSPADALRAATRAGALAQGRSDCGLIKEGFKADLCVFDTTGASWAPMTDPLCNLIYAGHGSDCVLTLCDGRVVYRDGEFPAIDMERAKAEVSARTQRILKEL